MINILILEDNDKEYEILKDILYDINESLMIFYENSISSAQEVILKNNVDIFFLDINLPEGSGIEFAKI